MIDDKKIGRFLIKYVFNPSIVYFLYFLVVAAFGLTKNQAFLLYAMTLPWLFIFLLFFYLPFLTFLFRISDMTLMTKINHVLEHGTIYFLKERAGNKCTIGGRSFDNGFRIYGDIESQKDIASAFDELSSYLGRGQSAAVLSKYCGSNTHILGGVSFILLTITLLVFLFLDLDVITVFWILLTNTAFYFLLRYPIGKYFQKKYVMNFHFTEPQIISIDKVKKKGLWERNPVYFVKTAYNIRISSREGHLLIV